MGHCVEAFVARSELLEAGIARLRHAHAFPLDQGFSIVPISDELYDEINTLVGLTGDAPFPVDFYKLSPSIAEFARQFSESSSVIYFETDYFGGVGTQSAIVWQDGDVVLGPFKTGDETLLADGAINRALRYLGVVRGQIDEFDSVGLGHFRSNEDWIEGRS